MAENDIWTIKAALDWTAGYLERKGDENPRISAQWLLCEACGMRRIDLYTHFEQPLTLEERDVLRGYVTRRGAGEPLQYILGVQEFMSLEFIVNPNVLIPRQDTETLVEYVLEKTKNKGFVLLDIGTGTGCIPLSIAHCNSRAFVRGIDVSDAAVALAKENSERLGLTKRADFEKTDILTDIPRGKYDVITSNPPYIESSVIETLQTEVKDYEPKLALDGGTDGLVFYRRICNIAPDILADGGLLAFEIGYNQGAAVAKLMEKDFSDIRIIKDLCGNDRVAAGMLK